MRTIAEIRDSIASDFMASVTVAETYGFTPGSSFSETFSKVSLEWILFTVFASAAWILESLFEAHKNDVQTALDTRLPHRTKWYRDKVLGFMSGKTLIPDTDTYDTSGMSDGDIEAAHVVKFAAATENASTSILTIKIAGEQGGERCRLSDEIETEVAAYIAEIKDAGVRINLVNSDPDTFSCTADIHYNPLLSANTVKAACEKAVKDYVENLPFNGEYSNMALVDALQAVEGVKVVEFRSAQTHLVEEDRIATIEGRYTPAAGYFQVSALHFNMVAYE